LAGAGFSAAKEVALDLFIAGQIGFLDMAELVERVLNTLGNDFDLGSSRMDLDRVLEMDHLARQTAARLGHRLRAG